MTAWGNRRDFTEKNKRKKTGTLVLRIGRVPQVQEGIRHA